MGICFVKAIKSTQIFLFAMVLLQAVTAAADDGTPVWTNRYSSLGANNDIPAAVSLDTSNNLFVVGQSSNHFITLKYSNSGNPLWTNRYNGPGNAVDSATALAIDSVGNVFVTGASGNDFATLKYSSAGLASWTNRFNGGSAVSIGIDTNGNVYVAGNAAGSGNFDMATIKYSNLGVPLWTNRYNGTANMDDRVKQLAVSRSGEAYIAGYSESNGFYEWVTIKYSSSGIAQWTNFFSGLGSGQPASLAVGGDDQIYLTGSTKVSGGYYSDYTTLKYSSDGIAIWTNYYNGSASTDDQAAALALDRDNNVFVTGYSGGVGFEVDFTTIKYSFSGVPLWTNSFDGASHGTDRASYIAVDPYGNVFVAGYTFVSFSGRQFATIKYAGDGRPLWTNMFDGDAPGYDETRALAVDKYGNAFVSGYSVFRVSSMDIVTIKYSAAPAYFGFVTENFLSGSDRFVASLVGPAGSNAVISTSTDLYFWIPVYTNLLDGGLLNFTDTVTPGSISRFYKAKLQ